MKNPNLKYRNTVKKFKSMQTLFFEGVVGYFESEFQLKLGSSFTLKIENNFANLFYSSIRQFYLSFFIQENLGLISIPSSTINKQILKNDNFKMCEIKQSLLFFNIAVIVKHLLILKNEQLYSCFKTVGTTQKICRSIEINTNSDLVFHPINYIFKNTLS